MILIAFGVFIVITLHFALSSQGWIVTITVSIYNDEFKRFHAFHATVFPHIL